MNKQLQKIQQYHLQIWFYEELKRLSSQDEAIARLNKPTTVLKKKKKPVRGLGELNNLPSDPWQLDINEELDDDNRY